MKNLRRDKKPRAYYWLKTSTMKNKIWIQGFILLKPTNLSQTTWLVPSFSASQLLLSGHTWSLHQARFLLEFIQEENGFLHKTKRMRDECFRNQPLFILRKSIFFKKILGKLGWIFFIGKHLLNGEERKKISHGYYSHHFQKWGRFDFKWEWNLNPKVENWS